MLHFFQRIAQRLTLVTPLLWLIVTAGLGCGLYELLVGFTTQSDKDPLILILLVTVWSFYCVVFIKTFHHLPPPTASITGWFKRMKNRIKRGLYQLLAGSWVILSLAVLMLLIRWLKLWLT